MLNIAQRHITSGAGGSLFARQSLKKRSALGHIAVLAPGLKASRFSYMIRGGMSVGLLVAAAGSVAFGFAGIPYSPMAQTVIAAAGILAGAILGAREAA